MGVYEERGPPDPGMHWQPANSQERIGSGGLALGCQGAVGVPTVSVTGGEQTRDLSPCLPASMGDAARPTALPPSPPPTQPSQTSSGPVTTLQAQQQQQTQQQQPQPQQQLIPGQSHCTGTNNNCYDSAVTPYDSREFGSPGDPNSEFRNNNYEHMGQQPQHHHHHHHPHPHHHHHHHHPVHHHHLRQHPHQPKLEPPSTPPPLGELHQQHTHQQPQPPFQVVMCAGCGLRISDRFYLQAVDRRWHASCLQCSHCRQGLDGEVTCFSRDGNIYCKKDYYRMFGSMKRCARCQAAILASELVMRARELVFHVRCFSCAACAVPLTKGDHFGMREGAVLCRAHFEMGQPLQELEGPHSPYPSPVAPHFAGPGFPGQPEFLQQQQQQQHPGQPHQQPPGSQAQQPQQVPLQASTPTHPNEAASPAKMGYFNGSSPIAGSAAVTVACASQVPPPRQKGRPRKRKPKDLEAMAASLDLNTDYIDLPFGRGGPGTPGLHGSNSRTKRMRTSFKHHQLRTMKSYFAINHNPDAKDLKQLSQKTGLPKRVLQVWFQNARAKWRRMVLKQEGKSDGVGGPKCPSGPCAGDPGSLAEQLELYGAGANPGAGGPAGGPMSPGGFGVLQSHSPGSMGSSLDCA